MRGIAILLSLLFAGAAFADAPNADRIRALNKEMQTQYDLGHYAEALKAAEELYQLKPTSGVLFNVAQCHRQLGEFKEAAHAYRLFLTKVEPGSTEAVKAQELLGQVEEAQKQKEAALKAQPLETAPIKATPPAEWQKPAAPTPAVVYVPAPPPPPSHKAAFVLGGTAVTALAASVVLGVMSKSAASSLTASIHDQNSVQDLAKKHDVTAHLADIGFALSGVLALATVIAW